MGSGQDQTLASRSTIRLSTGCPSGPGNTCISCKHEGLRVVSIIRVYSTKKVKETGFEGL